MPWPPPNCWLGVSVEDQARADERIPHLLRTPAAVRFLSVEPMLGPIDLSKWVFRFTPWTNAGGPDECQHGYAAGIPCPDYTPRLHLVIVGGESGPKARPCDLAWIRSIRDQCRAAGVPCFVKQIGTDPRYTEADIWAGHADVRRRNPKGGDMEEWPPDLRVRELPVIGQAAGRVP